MELSIVLLFSLSLFDNVNGGIAVASSTNVTTPSDGIVTNTSILNANAYFIITARQSDGSLALDNETLYAELWSKDGCETGTASASCKVLCYPYTLPHTGNPECLSTSKRPTLSPTTALWAIAEVTSLGSAQYKISYENSVEIEGYYTPKVYLIKSGGLHAKYYDNIWLVGTIEKEEIDYVINHEWGTGALTTYGQDYISIQWYGKVM